MYRTVSIVSGGATSKAMISATLSRAGAKAATANLVSEFKTPDSSATRLMNSSYGKVHRVSSIANSIFPGT